MLEMHISSKRVWIEKDLRFILQALHRRGVENARVEEAGFCLYKGMVEHGIRVTVYSRVMLREIVEVWEATKSNLPLHELECCWIECPTHSGCVYDILKSKLQVSSE